MSPRPADGFDIACSPVHDRCAPDGRIERFDRYAIFDTVRDMDE